MGDRFVVGFRETKNSPTMYLYSHWGGDERHKTLAEAIDAARPRWGDAAYATRIAVSTIVGNDWERETGFGLSVGSFCMPDYSDVAIVTWDEQRVDVVNDNDVENVLATMSLNDYVHTIVSGSLIVAGV